MSYLSWDGKVNFDTANNLLAVLDVPIHAGIDEDLLVDLNDSGMSFDEIAAYLDQTNQLTNLRKIDWNETRARITFKTKTV
jgi:hypothetical protein